MLHIDPVSTSPARRWAATTILAVIAALAFTALGVPAQSSSAAPAPAPRPANNYGAIALSADGAVGASIKSTSTKRAYQNAMRQCRNRSNFPGTCKRMVWVRNGCAAVAFRFGRDGYVSRVKAVTKKRTLRAAKVAARRPFGGRVAAICTRRNY